MLTANILHELNINNHNIILAEIRHRSRDNPDTYTCIQVKSEITGYVYILKGEKSPTPINNEEKSNTICNNCGRAGKTKIYYGCNLMKESNSVRNKDINLCENCHKELSHLYEEAIDTDSTEFIKRLV
jgi:uncharacterized protein with PIN domain